jgi:hypothetical protein
MYTFPDDLEGMREQRNRMNENSTWHPTWQQVDNDSWSTKCQSTRTMFHHKLLTREGRDLANG